jgi:hypothetical protein
MFEISRNAEARGSFFMVTAALRGVIEGDRFRMRRRLDPLKAALGKLEAEASSAAGPRSMAPPAGKGDKRGR